MSDNLIDRQANERTPRGRVYTEIVTFCTTAEQRQGLERMIQQSGRLLDISTICRWALAEHLARHVRPVQADPRSQISQSTN